jgi:DNA-binding CsgD family transcriptional regulator
MLFFGLSDIVYVFLFSTAASISSAYGKKVFMGFVLIFGFALLGGFGLSYFLYDYFQDLFGTVYALVSLLMLAVSFLLAPLLRSVTGRIASDSVTRCDCTHVLSCLTTRENEIVLFYLEGYSNQQIAEALHIAPSTVKVHSRNIYEKLNIKSRIELIFLFQKKQEEK